MKTLYTTIKQIGKLILVWSLLWIHYSCSNFVEVEPPQNEITRSTVFTDDASATSAMMGIYSEMSAQPGFISGSRESLYVLTGLSADEFNNHSPQLPVEAFYFNALTPDNSVLYQSLWEPAYTYIYQANAIIEGLEASKGVSEATTEQLTGEALFVRGFCYFYLLNLFGDVPLITGTAIETNRLAGRTSTHEVYDQVIEDLELARTLMTEDYSLSNNSRFRPNSYTATALLARVYLYVNDLEMAEAMATRVIESGLYRLTALDEVFLNNNREAIWQLQPVTSNNTREAGVYIPASDNSRPAFVSISETLLNAFEQGDLRKEVWIESVTTADGTVYYYPYKYKIADANVAPTEASVVFRLAEMYLIRAESRIRQGKLAMGKSDLDLIRDRSGLGAISANTQEALMQAVFKERQTEFFAEGGHRWIDLKRSGLADTLLNEIKTDWQTTDVWYPIPQKEREANPNLNQNEGY